MKKKLLPSCFLYFRSVTFSLVSVSVTRKYLISSDYFQSRTLAEMVKHFDWTRVGAIRRDDDYGNTGMAAFTYVDEQLGLCLEFSLPFSKTYSQDRVLRMVEQVKSDCGISWHS